MASVQANGITVEYEVHGEGDPLLLVMGLGGQLTDWTADVVDEFVARGFQVIRYDNRDVGLSTAFDWEPPTRTKALMSYVARRPAQAEYLVRDMAADGAALLDVLGVDSAHVAGVSMGGMIAQSMAIEHSEKVRTLTSIMSHSGDRKHGGVSKRLTAKLLRQPELTRENAIDESVRGARLISGPHFDAVEVRRLATANLERSFRPEGFRRQLAAINASPDRTDGLASVVAPTLVIHGLADQLILPSGGVATTRAVPGSRIVLYPDMAHDLPKPRHAEIADEIRRHADSAA